MSRKLQIKTARVFKPLLDDHRYKGAFGGRGSGKSHFFAEHLIEDSLYHKGLLSVCIREVQKSLKDSAKRLLEAKLRKFGLGGKDGFKIFNDVIQTPGDGIITFTGMKDHNSESIKSLEGFKRAWGEEAQTLSHKSLRLLRPTLRDDESQMWFSWNPRRKSDAIDTSLRGAVNPTGAIAVEANWSDNPWFTKVLEQERLDCKRDDPDNYDHIWEGEYETILKGAYYSELLTKARKERRITTVAVDPLLPVKLFTDIGGTGAKSDAFTIWAAQFVGREIRMVNYYEVVGQPIGTHLAWLKGEGYTPDRAEFFLPHDGSTHDRVYDVSYESALSKAGYEVTVVPNQGKGAAAARINACRSLFSFIIFDETNCEEGIEGLRCYHERWDENRNVGLGPEHDWASHGADAFGLMAIVYELPDLVPHKNIKFRTWRG